MLILVRASLYTAGVTRRACLAVVFAGVLAALFGFLHIVLTLETYSLMTGSLALFVGLSVVMVVTRHLDWSRAKPDLKSRIPEAELPPA